MKVAAGLAAVSVAVLALVVDLQNPKLATVRDGESVALPWVLEGECVRVIVTHGTCGLCRKVLPAPGTVWLTQQRHGGDTLFSPLVVSRQAYDALGVKGIPVEFLLERGRVLWVGSPFSDRRPPDSYCTGGDRAR